MLYIGCMLFVYLLAAYTYLIFWNDYRFRDSIDCDRIFVLFTNKETFRWNRNNHTVQFSTFIVSLLSMKDGTHEKSICRGLNIAQAFLRETSLRIFVPILVDNSSWNSVASVPCRKRICPDACDRSVWRTVKWFFYLIEHIDVLYSRAWDKWDK